MTNVSIKNKLIILFSLCYTVAIGQKSKTLDFKFDTLNFNSYSIDINNDLKNDIVCFSKPVKGDSLFVFIAQEEGYERSLQTSNFTMDGLYFIQNVTVQVEKNVPVLRLETMFNGSGSQQLTYFIAYNAKKRRWKLIRTEESGTICQAENDCCEYLHILPQKLMLDKKVNWNRMHHCKAHDGDLCH